MALLLVVGIFRPGNLIGSLLVGSGPLDPSWPRFSSEFGFVPLIVGFVSGPKLIVGFVWACNE